MVIRGILILTTKSQFAIYSQNRNSQFAFPLKLSSDRQQSIFYFLTLPGRFLSAAISHELLLCDEEEKEAVILIGEPAAASYINIRDTQIAASEI